MLLKILCLLLVYVAAVWITGWTRRYAINHELIDHPNQRSSHTIPTPSGGGVGIVIAFALGLLFLLISGTIDTRPFLAITGGGMVVAIVGYLDDRRDLPAAIRFPGHILAAIWATAWIGGIPSVELGFTVLKLGWLGYVISVVGITWLLNLYNFMDGIDGLAGSEAALVAGVGGLLLLAEDATGPGWAALTLAAAALGFLYWNWPKAKIFMGDVASGFLGYTLAVFALISGKESAVSHWVWLLLLGVFVVDATVTLFKRLSRGEKPYEAHRSHAYQHLTQRFDSHLKVTLGVIGINGLILAPLALLIWQVPDVIVPVVGVTLVILAAVALWLGAGVDDPTTLKRRPSNTVGAKSST